MFTLCLSFFPRLFWLKQTSALWDRHHKDHAALVLDFRGTVVFVCTKAASICSVGAGLQAPSCVDYKVQCYIACPLKLIYSVGASLQELFSYVGLHARCNVTCTRLFVLQVLDFKCSSLTGLQGILLNMCLCAADVFCRCWTSRSLLCQGTVLLSCVHQGCFVLQKLDSSLTGHGPQGTVIHVSTI